MSTSHGRAAQHRVSEPTGVKTASIGGKGLLSRMLRSKQGEEGVLTVTWREVWYRVIAPKQGEKDVPVEKHV